MNISQVKALVSVEEIVGTRIEVQRAVWCLSAPAPSTMIALR